jgi:hypothetical protein
MREKFIEFETSFIKSLTSVNETNHKLIIQELEELITKHKAVLSKSQVLTILYKINHEFEMNDLQEKLFIEIEHKVMGNFSFE